MQSTEPFLNLINDRTTNNPLEILDNLNFSRRSVIESDSGYASNTSLSLDDVSTNISLYRTPLEPIREDVEVQSYNRTPILTPTSKNVQLIDAFHITTPDGSKIHQNRIGSKRHVLTFYDYNPKKLESFETNVYRTPTKKTQSNLHRLNRENSFEFPTNEDIENSSFVEKTSSFNNSISNSSILTQSHRQFQRKLSENSLPSSTPIDNHILTKSKTRSSVKQSSKQNIFRKTQSFSPSKYFQQKYDDPGKEANIVQRLPNPARQLLNFSPNVFNRLVHKNNLEQPTFNFISNESLKLDMSAEVNQSNYLMFDCETSVKGNISLEPTITETEDLRMKTNPTQLEDWHVRKPLHTFSKIKRKFPDVKTNQNHQSASPQINETESTPKRFRRSISLNNADPVIERNLILYSRLPCTPPKNRCPCRKRAALLCKKSKASPVKRKLYETSSNQIGRKRFYYDGIQKLDILRHLAETTPAIELILGDLSGADLISAYAVSQCWSRIITNYDKANARRRKYLKTHTDNKENNETEVVSYNTTPSKGRTPFGRYNGSIKPKILSALQMAAPQISPSKQLFLEYQTKLDKVEKCKKFQKCPRCGNASIVNDMSLKMQNHEPVLSQSPFRKSTDSCVLPFQKSNSISFDENCYLSSTFQHSKLNKDVDYLNGITVCVPSSNNKRNKFATCIAPRCQFIFCTKCLCEYNAEHVCVVSLIECKESVSKIMDSDKTAVSGTKRSKRNLRRLCSIDKI